MNEFEMQQLAVLHRIANALETIALTNAPAPNFVKPIGAYANFDFTSIGATVKQVDPNGPTELEWGGYLWTRRSPSNKFGEAIWYSRATGKDAEGNVKYARLITFRKMTEAEPLPAKVEKMVQPPVGRVIEPSAVKTVVYPVRAEAATTATPASELDQYLGPRLTSSPTPTGENGNGNLPATKAEFEAWLKAHHINGQETRSALGTDAASWLRMNAGKAWADVAQTIAATLGK